MNKSLKRFLLLFAVLCVFVCGLVFAVACGDNGGSTGGGGGQNQKVTYSVTVTADSGFDFTAVKAQWKQGSENVSDEIALSAEGKASVELDSGNYTVDLVGVDTETYQYTPASVTPSNPDAQIAITAKTIETYNVVVSVSVSGVELPAEAAVQLYNGTELSGAPVAITNNMATVKVPVGSTGYTVGIVNLPDYIGGGEAKAVPETAGTLSFTLSLKEVTYTVNVTSDTTLPGGVKAELWAADASEATASADVADNSATITALAGDYTVKLSGLGSAYTYDEGSVTKTERTATIQVKLHVYTLTLAELPANVQADAISTLTAQLYKGDDVCGEPVSFNDGVAVIPAAADDYTVKFAGAEGYDGFCSTALTAEADEATVYVGATGTLGAAGDYVLPVESNSVSVSITAVSAEKPFHVVTWSPYADDVISFGSSTAPAVKHNINGEVYVVTDGSVSFTLTRVGSGSKVLLHLAVGEAPAEGDIHNPAVGEEVVQTYSLPESSEATDAYFSVPVWDTLSYEIKFEDANVDVYWLGSDINTEIAVDKAVLNGGVLTSAESGVNYVYVQLKEGVTGADKLTFEIVRHYEAGESPATAFELTKGESFPAAFPNVEDKDLTPIWFKYTPDQNGDYTIKETGTNIRSIKYSVYGNYNETNGTDRMLDKVACGTKMTLEADHTYYIAIDPTYQRNNDFAISVVDYVAVPGTKDAPFEVTETGDKLNNVTLLYTNGDDTYFKFVVTEDAINEDGDVTFSFAVTVGSMKVAFYDDANYSHNIGSAGIVGDAGMVTVARLSGLSVDDVVYFTINGYGTAVSFYINPVDTSKMLTLDTPLELDIGGAQYSSLTVETQVYNVPAGDYKLTIITDGEVSQPAPFDVKIDNVTVFSNLFLNTSVNQTQEFTLQSAAETLTITTAQFLASGVIHVTLLLEDANFKLALDTPLSVEFDGTEYNAVSLEIPLDAGIAEGEYVLNIQVGSTSNNAPFEIRVDGGGTGEDGIYDNMLAGDHDIVLTAQSTKITIYTSTFMNGSPIEMTLTLKKAAPKLTLDNSLEVDISGSSATIALGVSAGTYQLAYDFGMNVYMATIIADIGGNQYYISTPFSGGQTGTVDITVPDGANVMTLNIQNNGGATTLTLSLTQLAASYKYVAELGTGLAVEGVGFGQSNGVLIGLGESIVPGDYELRISTELDGYGIFVNGEEISAVGGVVSFTVTADTKDFTLYHFVFGTTIMTTVTITKAQSSEPTEGDITVGEETPITDVGESFADKTVYLTAGTYTLTLSGVDASVIQVNNYSDDNNNIIAAGALTGTLTVTEDGMITLRFINSLWDGQAKTFSILIAAGGSTGPVGPQEPDLVVGEEATFTIPTTNDGSINKTIYLEAGDYTITLTYDCDGIAVSNYEEVLGGFMGGILVGDFDMPPKSGTFTVAEAGLYTFTFQDVYYEGGMEITVLIEVSGGSQSGADLTLGEPGTVEFTGIPNSEYCEEVTKTIQLEEGWYTITLSGDFSSVSVTNSLGDTIIYRGGGSGELQIEATGLVELTFNYYGTAPLSITVTITAQ